MSTIVQLIEGDEGYGVAAVVRRLLADNPEAMCVALGPGKLADEIPNKRKLWQGDRRRNAVVGKSTIGGLYQFVRNFHAWWRISGRVARSLPSDPCLIHCHATAMCIVSGLVRLRSHGKVRVVFHFHSTMNRRRLFGLLPRIQRLVVGRMCDRIIAVSDSAAANWRPNRVPISVVYNGVTIDQGDGPAPHRFVSKPGVKDILLVGSLSRDKGHHVAIDAFGLLGRDVSHFHLWIAGGPISAENGSYTVELRRRVSALRLEKYVTLLGFVPNARDLASRVWLGLQQRISDEPCSVWVLEALAAGLPLIATGTGGTPELVRDRVEALLVPPERPDLVAAAIREIAGNPELHNALSRRARLRSSKFTNAAFAAAISREYELLLAAP